MENVNVIKICEKVNNSFYTEINIIKYKGRIFRTKFVNSKEMVGEFNINACLKVLTDNGWAILADRSEICPDLTIESFVKEDKLKEYAKVFLNAAIEYINILY